MGEVHRSDLVLLFLAMVVLKGDDSRAPAIGHYRVGNHHVGPASEIVRAGDLEKTLPLAGFFKINRGDKHFGGRAVTQSGGEPR